MAEEQTSNISCRNFIAGDQQIEHQDAQIEHQTVAVMHEQRAKIKRQAAAGIHEQTAQIKRQKIEDFQQQQAVIQRQDVSGLQQQHAMIQHQAVEGLQQQASIQHQTVLQQNVTLVVPQAAIQGAPLSIRTLTSQREPAIQGAGSLTNEPSTSQQDSRHQNVDSRQTSMQAKDNAQQAGRDINKTDNTYNTYNNPNNTTVEGSTVKDSIFGNRNVKVDHHYYYSIKTPSESAESARPKPTNYTPEDISLETIKEDLKRAQQEVVSLGLNYEQENFPCVHPVLRKEENFFLGGAGKTENYKPSTQQRYVDSGSKEISFERLHEYVVPHRYTALVGAPGSGKSTIARRLSNTSCITWILLLCMDMYYGSKKVTLRQVVVDHAYPWLSERKRNAIFAAMMEFPEKFGIILDGYDQATWSLNNVNPRNASYDTPMLVEEVVTNLCTGKFLPRISIVLTSRPHSIVTLHELLRPKEIVLVHEFTPDNMKKLFFAFAKNEAQRIWESFTKLAPVLLEICLTPIMLQLILLAALGTDNLIELCNITQIFIVLLENLRRSVHAKGHDIKNIKVKLAKIAYNATKNSTVIMTFSQMVEQGLSDVIVQDIVIAVPGYSHFNQKLFDGDKKFYFSHQLLQEFYTAVHISQNMSLDEFSQIVDKLVASPHWAMVRRFECGLLLGDNFTMNPEPDESSSDGEQTFKKINKPSTSASTHLAPPQPLDGAPSTLQVAKQQAATSPVNQPNQPNVDQSRTDNPQKPTNEDKAKAEKLYKRLLKQFKREPNDIIGMIVDLQECNEAVLQSFAKHFPVVADFSFIFQTIGTSSCHALGRMLQHVDKTIERLGLGNCELTSQGCEHICGGIGKMTHKLKWLYLSHNQIQNAGVKSLSEIVHKLEVLGLDKCWITDISPLTDAIKNKDCKLKKLYLNHNQIENAGVKSLSEIVHKLKGLWLEGCGITDISPLTDAIKNKDCKLKELNLGFNQIQNAGVKSLSEIVHNVEVLWLEGCGITDIISPLTDAIKNKDCKIKQLVLRDNRIGDQGALEFSRVLPNIELLQVGDCGITEEGKEVIRSKLRELGLDENRVRLTSSEVRLILHCFGRPTIVPP